MKIGYIRVSTQEQNTIRQEILMERLGVDELYIDRASGKNAQRPELQKMMEYVRRGDTVIVESISRFARNTRDLLELVERLTGKGVEFISIALLYHIFSLCGVTLNISYQGLFFSCPHNLGRFTWTATASAWPRCGQWWRSTTGCWISATMGSASPWRLP